MQPDHGAEANLGPQEQGLGQGSWDQGFPVWAMAQGQGLGQGPWPVRAWARWDPGRLSLTPFACQFVEARAHLGADRRGQGTPI